MLSDIAFDVELEVAAYKASLAVDHAPETAISVISSWARRGDNFDYTLSVSRRTSDADFKMTIVQDTESTLAFGNAHSLTIDAVLPGSSYITELEELQRKEEMHRRLNVSSLPSGRSEYAVRTCISSKQRTALEGKAMTSVLPVSTTKDYVNRAPISFRKQIWKCKWFFAKKLHEHGVSLVSTNFMFVFQNNPTLPEQSETESGLWDFFERCEEDGQKYTKCKSCSYRFSEPDDTNCRRSNKYRQRRHHKTYGCKVGSSEMVLRSNLKPRSLMTFGNISTVPPRTAVSIQRANYVALLSPVTVRLMLNVIY